MTYLPEDEFRGVTLAEIRASLEWEARHKRSGSKDKQSRREEDTRREEVRLAEWNSRRKKEG